VLAEHPEAVHPSPPGPATAPGERPSRRGRLRITTWKSMEPAVTRSTERSRRCSLRLRL
jgi:hypothetical protein